MLFSIILVLLFAIQAFGQQACQSTLRFGKSCPQNKPLTKWFFDAESLFCYPYQYLGCDEGLNSFESVDSCLELCKPADQFSCGGNSESKGVCYSPNDPGCVNGTICVRGGTIGFCCDKKIQDEWDKEHSPTCLKGQVVQFEQWFGKTPLIGRNCSHNFCPSGSTCVQEKWTAHCCQ